MLFNRKVEIVFSKQSQKVIDGQSKICNWLYNYLLEIVGKENDESLLYGRNLRNLVPKTKLEKPFLKSVHSSPLKNVALRLKLSFDNFIKYDRKRCFFIKRCL